MIIDSVQYYKIGYAADITGYTIQELKDLFNDQNIPGKEVVGEIVFSMDDIKSIQKKRKALHLMRPAVKYPEQTSPVPKEATITADEAADRTGYKASTLRTYVDAGKIEGHFINHKLYFTEEQVQKIEDLKNSSGKSLSHKEVKISEPEQMSLKEPEHEKKKRIRHYPHYRNASEIPGEYKREYECAKRIAKVRGEPVMVYLLKQAKQDIAKKKDLIKTLRE